MPDLQLPPLYAILDIDALGRRSLDPRSVLADWIEAGVRLAQLRAKGLSGAALLELADELSAMARAAGCTFIVNDRADIARLSGAAGVHLGQEDLRPTEARRVLEPEAIVGCSTHYEAQVRAALDEPIDYLAIGPVFETGSKANPDPVVGLEGVHRAAELARARRIPVVAIGGITLESAVRVLDAGAASVAVISDLLEGDISTRATAYLRTLRRQ